MTGTVIEDPMSSPLLPCFRDDQQATAGARHCAAHCQQIAVRIDQLHPEVGNGDGRAAHVACHLLAFVNAARRGARARSTWCAQAVRLTVRAGAAMETVPANAALETATFGNAL